MKRRLMLVLVVAVVVALSATAIRHELKSGAKKKREAAYQSALQRYSQQLSPGLTRKEVEIHFRASGTKFHRMGWLEEAVEDRTALADLVQVGQEDAPWFCSESIVYIAFEFGAIEPHEPWGISDTDVLKRIRIFRYLSGCL